MILQVNQLLLKKTFRKYLIKNLLIKKCVKNILVITALKYLAIGVNYNKTNFILTI